MIGICKAIYFLNVKHKPINQNQNSKHCFIIKFDFDNCKLIKCSKAHSSKTICKYFNILNISRWGGFLQ